MYVGISYYCESVHVCVVWCTCMNPTVLILKFNNDISLLTKMCVQLHIVICHYLRLKLVTLDICKQRIWSAKRTLLCLLVEKLSSFWTESTWGETVWNLILPITYSITYICFWVFDSHNKATFYTISKYFFPYSHWNLRSVITKYNH